MKLDWQSLPICFSTVISGRGRRFGPGGSDPVAPLLLAFPL